MGTRARVIQCVGVLAFLVAALLPCHEPRCHPRLGELPLPGRGMPTGATLLGNETPARELTHAFTADLRGPRFGERLWEVRRWYPQALAPVWALALLAVLGPVSRARGRRLVVGALMVVLAAALALLEACYLAVEYAPLLGGPLGRVEVLGVWLLVLAILALRRRGAGGLGGVEAHVGSQALLGLVHMLTLPATQARGWWREAAWSDLFAALATNFRPPFWIACAALALVAAPAYLGRRARPAESFPSVG